MARILRDNPAHLDNDPDRGAHPVGAGTVPSMGSATTFVCPWRHPACDGRPGPNHFRHVPVAEAAALPQTPDYYLVNAWVDKAAFLALAARRPRSADVRTRVIDLARFSPDRFPGEQKVTGREWLCAALSGDDLTPDEVSQVAAHVFPVAGDDPLPVVNRILTHPSTSADAAGAVVDSSQWASMRSPEVRVGALELVDAAGWPATLAWEIARGRSGDRRRDDSAGSPGQVLVILAAEPSLVPVAQRLMPDFAGDAHTLLMTARAVNGAPGRAEVHANHCPASATT